MAFLYAEAQSQAARTNFYLASKGIVVAVCFSVRLGAIFLSTPSGRLGTNILLLPASQALHFPGSLSNSQGPQILVPKEDLLFCFPAAVPASTAAAIPDVPAVEKLCSSLQLCVCVLMFAQACVLGKVCVCARIKAASADRYRECSSSRVCLQVGVCKLCVCIYGAGLVLEMWV